MRERVQWYAARWAAMEPGEVSHRCMEFLKKTAWRFDRRAWRHFDAGNGPLADFADLRSRLAAAFEVSSSEGLAAYSQGVQAGRLKLLGVSWPAHWAEGFAQGELPPRFWFQDPVSGQCWPGAEQYCFAIGYRHARRAPGDIKVIWELNRLQFLHPLAAEIAARSRSDLARWSLRLIQSWAEANPPFRGINWCSGIELALRLVSILLLVSAIGPHGLMPAERTLLRRLIWAHAYWLARYPSRYSSANNHLLAEGLGLYIAGRLVPDLPGAPMWRAMGARTMQQEALKQIYADGVGVEQSPSYQAFSMEMIAFLVLLAQEEGEPIEQAVLARLAQGAAFLQALMDDSGHVPAIGDNDEGRVLAQPPDREPRYVASVLASVAGLLQRPDLGPPARSPHLRDSLFDAYEPGPVSRPLVRTFPEGGYTLVDTHLAGRSVHLCFDHGPLGYLTLCAHGHADALALWLSVDGAPVFIDAGTYLYHAARKLRDQLRETPAHNTLSLAGSSQSRVAGAFMWASTAKARLLSAQMDDNWRIIAEHDGYVRRFGVRHVRQIARMAGGIRIGDRLDGNHAAHEVAIHFLCHPRLRVLVADEDIQLSDGRGPVMTIIPPHGFQVEMIHGEAGTARGWYAPFFGTLVPAPLLVLKGHMADQEAVTELRFGAVAPHAPRDQGRL